VTLSAPELYRRARAHLNAGRNAAARRDLTRAADLTDDPDLLARIDGSLAALIIRQGDPDSAERLCRIALERDGLSSETQAMLSGQLGLLALERGDLDDAVTLLDRGIADIGDEIDHRAAMLINRGVAHSQAGRLALAADDLERAASDYAAMGDDVQRAMAVHNAGYVALLAGDLVGALQAMARARAVMEDASAVNAAICDLDRAEVLRDAGMARDAERNLERVAQVFGAHRMRQARGEAQFHRARSLLAHAPAEASVAAARAARTFRDVGSEWWALRADAVRLRARLEAAAAHRGRAPSQREVDEIVRRLDARRMRADAASLRLSAELWRARAGAGEGASVRTPPDAPIPVRLLAHEVRAARARARGDHTGARRHAARGLDALAEWQASFGSLDLASSLTLHGGGLILAGLSAATRSERPAEVFEWSERARLLSQQSVPLRPPPDPDLAADLAELRMLRADADSSDWLAHPRAAELAERVRDRQWTATGAAPAASRTDLDGLRAQLGDGTAFVTFVFDGDGLSALAVTDSDERLVRVEDWPAVEDSLAALRADLDMSAAVRQGPLARTVAQALEARLASLARQLLGPLLPTIADRRLVLTVPGVLGGVPWGMLPPLRGRVFTVATSATQWVGRVPWVRPARVGFAAGPGVARGGEEISRAAAAWSGPAALRDTDATVDAVTDLAAHVDLLHVAAHGKHSREHPLFSGLDLVDGTLFGYDIDLVAAPPQTVVLSACEVGRSSSRGGEEAIGMTRIWLHAGTGTVVASPVVVADDAACDVLGAMHADLAAGESPAVALARATERTGLLAPFQAHGAGF
jgi:tetratricopeptide (TPR) repeat protein